MLRLPQCVAGMAAMLVLVACSGSSMVSSHALQPESLRTAIASLSASIDEDDAAQIAQFLLQSTDELATEYNMARPPRFHNLLVHVGLRKRGLCCHWAADLRVRLQGIGSSLIRLDWVVTRHGQALLEHNSLVIHAADSTWEQGLVFDPWRKSGLPYWVRVQEDMYTWKQHPLSGNWEKLRCKL